MCLSVFLYRFWERQIADIVKYIIIIIIIK